MPKQGKYLLLVILAALALSAWAVGAEGEAGSQRNDASYQNQEGLKHFKTGFYEMAPKNRREEAARAYGLAIQSFKRAIALDPEYADAHRNLARVYYVQKKYRLAAEHYQALTRLNGYDLDAYMYAASAYERAGEYDAAIAVLEAARQKTTDPQIVGKINKYIKTVEKEMP